jgi:hypothetical protein
MLTTDWLTKVYLHTYKIIKMQTKRAHRGGKSNANPCVADVT